MTGGEYGVANWGVKNIAHGSAVASMVSGAMLGLGKNIQTIIVSSTDGTTPRQAPDAREILEKVLESLVMVLQDVTTNNRGTSSVVSISWGINPKIVPSQFIERMRRFHSSPSQSSHPPLSFCSFTCYSCPHINQTDVLTVYSGFIHPT